MYLLTQDTMYFMAENNKIDNLTDDEQSAFNIDNTESVPASKNIRGMKRNKSLRG